MKKINEEVVNGKLYFYHSTQNLNAALYIVNKQWRTTMGMYGNGIYGQQYPDPTSPENRLSLSTISRYKNMYGGSYRFKIKYDKPELMFYADIDAGKQIYPDYSVDKAIEILQKHKVPQDTINSIKRYFAEGDYVPPISQSRFNTDKVDGGLLGKYGFKGLVYQGNQDGSCVVFWYPNEENLEVEAYSTDFGKTWIDYDSNNIQQVNQLRSDIQAEIDRLAGVVNTRKQNMQQTGKRPPLSRQGKDRDWIRVIECGDKAGYNFATGDFTSGNLNTFVRLVQKQINASKEPKRSNRYDIAIKILPEAAAYLTK